MNSPSRLLIPENPLIILPGLAVAVGLNEAIILQQIYYWLEINRKHNREGIDVVQWTYNTYAQWQEQFPWWSERTIRRAIRNLETLNVLISEPRTQNSYDHTKKYTINHNALDNLYGTNNSDSSGQNDQTDADKMTRGIGQNGLINITETTTENTTKTINTRVSKKSQKAQEKQAQQIPLPTAEETGVAKEQEQENIPPAPEPSPVEPIAVSCAEVTVEPKVTPVGFTSVTLVHLDGTLIDFSDLSDPVFAIDATPDPLDDPAMWEQEKTEPISIVQSVGRTPDSDAAKKAKERVSQSMAKMKPYMDASGLNVLDLSKYPEQVVPTVALFCQLWRIQPPTSKRSDIAYWADGADSLAKACGEIGEEVIKEVRKDFEKRMAEKGGLPPYDVSSPKSLVNMARGMAGRMREKGRTKAGDNVLDTAGTLKENGFFY